MIVELEKKGEDFQITLPEAIVKKLGWAVGDKLSVKEKYRMITVSRVPKNSGKIGEIVEKKNGKPLLTDFVGILGGESEG